jgi:nucleotide-binding universal stress UspA family protein
VLTGPARDAYTVTAQTEMPAIQAAPAFASILCGVDGSRPSFEAARQAATLAGDGAALSYLAVTWEQGRGANAIATLSHARGDDALRRLREASRDLPIRPSFNRVADPDAGGRLIALAARHDLLVLGIHVHSRLPGMLFGDTAATALHRSPVPVLVARRPPADTEFLRDILLAVDGTQPSRVATEAAARIARQHDSRVAIIAAPAHDAATRHAIAEDAALIAAAAGTEPVILDEYGPPHRAVAAAASEFGASLVVCGSRGLHGAAALRSVSERIAHAAPCSVLVMRPRAAAA